MTCIAALQLIEAGKLSPDDEVSKYVPEINDVKVLEGYDGDKPILKPLDKPVTIHHCLTHSTGSSLDFGGPSFALSTVERESD